MPLCAICMAAPVGRVFDTLMSVAAVVVPRRKRHATVFPVVLVSHRQYHKRMTWAKSSGMFSGGVVHITLSPEPVMLTPSTVVVETVGYLTPITHLPPRILFNMSAVAASLARCC